MRFPGATYRNIYVRSERAGQRVMESVKRFIASKLKLKVNEAKSAVAKPQERKFLGFSFYMGKDGPKRRIAPKALDKFKERIREITLASRGRSMKQTIEELSRNMRGWIAYFGFCETPADLKKPGLVDQEAAPMRLLAAVEDQPQAVRGTGETRREI